MKKVIALIFSMVTCLCIWAQQPTSITSISPSNLSSIADLQDGDWVVIKNCQLNPIEGYLCLNGDAIQFSGTLSPNVGTQDLNYLWQVHVKDPASHSYTISSYDGKYLPVLVNGGPVKQVVALESAESFVISNVTNNSNWCFQSVSNSSVGKKNSFAKAEGGLLASLSIDHPKGSNARANFQIFKVEVSSEVLTKAEVTFNYTYDGTTPLFTKKELQIVGQPVDVPHVDYLNCEFDNTQLVVNGANIVNVTCTDEVPFTVSDNLESAKWQTIDLLHENYLVYENDQMIKAVASDNADLDLQTSDAAKWCVVGSVLDGYKLYNKAAGISKAIGGVIGNVALVEAARAPKWFLTKSTENNYRGPRFHQKGKSEYLNLKTDDNGASYYLDLSVADAANSSCHFSNPNKKILDLAQTYDLPVGTVGALTYFNDQHHLDLLHHACAPFETDLWTSDVKAITELKDLLTQVKTQHEVNIFDPAKYYRLKNFCRDFSIDYEKHPGQGGYMGDLEKSGNVLSCHTHDLADATAVWQFEGTEGNYKIKNLNSGKYVGKTSSQKNKYVLQAEDADAGTYNVVDLGDCQFKLSCTNGGANGAVDLNGYSEANLATGIVNYNANKNSASAWYLVEATEMELVLNDGGNNEFWSTLYLPFNVSWEASGLKAFAGSVNGNSILLTDAGNSITANNAIILKGQQSKYTVNLSTATDNRIENNQLKGTNVVIDNEPSSYVLGNGVNGVGFYMPNAATLKANKAYIIYQNGVNPTSLRFVFDDEATGIENAEIVTDESNAVYYDLAGRRIAAPVHGVYIKNGKKIFVK